LHRSTKETILKTITESGVISNMTSTDGKYLNVGASIGFLSSNRFLLGVGLDNNLSQEVRYNKFDTKYFVMAEEMDIKSHVLLPNIFLVYYYPIINKLYFSTKVEFSFGNIKTDYKIRHIEAANLNNDSINLGTYNGYLHSSSVESESKSDVFSAQLSPGLTFFISKVFGINLGFGGIEYNIIDWETENSNWMVNFNPIYWKLGIKFLINNKTPAIE
jgi:hypothetical protein